MYNSPDGDPWASKVSSNETRVSAILANTLTVVVNSGKFTAEDLATEAGTWRTTRKLLQTRDAMSRSYSPISYRLVNLHALVQK